MLFISPCQFQRPRKSIVRVSTHLAATAPGSRRVTGVLQRKNVAITLDGQRLYLEIALTEIGIMANVELRGTFSLFWCLPWLGSS